MPVAMSDLGPCPVCGATDWHECAGATAGYCGPCGLVIKSLPDSVPGGSE